MAISQMMCCVLMFEITEFNIHYNLTNFLITHEAASRSEVAYRTRQARQLVAAEPQRL